jgi:hypothetical protein
MVDDVAHVAEVGYVLGDLTGRPVRSILARPQLPQGSGADYRLQWNSRLQRDQKSFRLLRIIEHRHLFILTILKQI